MAATDVIDVVVEDHLPTAAEEKLRHAEMKLRGRSSSDKTETVGKHATERRDEHADAAAETFQRTKRSSWSGIDTLYNDGQLPVVDHLPALSSFRSGSSVDDMVWLTSFVPKVLVTRFGGPAPKAPEVAEHFKLPGVLLFADISGFTRLTEMLASRGEEGAESLKNEINRFFNRIINAITAAGGDILFFAGDAMLALFPAADPLEAELAAIDQPMDNPGIRDNMRVQAAIATRCAMRIQKKLIDYESPLSGIVLRLRIGISAGVVSVLHVGGHHGNWFFLVVGDPLREVGEAESLALPAQVVLSPTAWDLVCSVATGTEVRMPGKPSGFHLVQSFPEPPIPRVIAAPSRAMSPQASTMLSPESSFYSKAERNSDRNSDASSVLSARSVVSRYHYFRDPAEENPENPSPRTILFNILRRFCNPSVADAFKKEKAIHLQAYEWLGELRPVTVLFVKIDAVQDMGTPVDARSQRSHDDHLLARVQLALASLQEVVDRHQGSINKVIMDDKGLLAVIGFGLPPLSFQDNSTRAILTALGIQQKLRSVDVLCSIGIGTGTAYCGAFGNKQRSEYAVLGDAVNVSARLMQHASGDIYADEATFIKTKTDISFEEMPKLSVKGKANALRAFRPLARHAPVSSGGTSLRNRTPLVGRSDVFGNLRNKILGFSNSKISAHLVLVGPSGIGKSRLLLEVESIARALPLTVIVSVGNQFEEHTPYFPWRIVFQGLLNSASMQPHVLSGHVRHLLRSLATESEDLASLAPLLNAVLPALKLQDNSKTKAMVGQVRADNIRSLCLRLLKHFSLIRPTVIMFDDAHWFDSASWSLILSATKELPQMFWITASRPLEGAASDEYLAPLQSDPKVSYIELAPLNPLEASELVTLALQASAVPPYLVDFIITKAEGNPYFLEEVVRTMTDQGYIVKSERDSVSAAVSLDEVHLPGTVKDVVISRVDSLEQTQQKVLKVAAVVGQRFLDRVVVQIFPFGLPEEAIRGCLSELVAAGLLEQIEANEYAFAQATVKDVAYSTLLVGHRKDLHAKLAKWYEEEEEAEVSAIAYHYSNSDQSDKALVYSDLAGTRAFNDYAMKEAAYFFGHALDLIEQGKVEITRSQRGRIESLNGSAHLLMGDNARGRHWTLQALKTFDEPLPSTPLSLLWDLIRNGYRHWRFKKRSAAFIDQEVQRYAENTAIPKGSASVPPLYPEDETGSESSLPPTKRSSSQALASPFKRSSAQHLVAGTGDRSESRASLDGGSVVNTARSPPIGSISSLPENEEAPLPGAATSDRTRDSREDIKVRTRNLGSIGSLPGASGPSNLSPGPGGNSRHRSSYVSMLSKGSQNSLKGRGVSQHSLAPMLTQQSITSADTGTNEVPQSPEYQDMMSRAVAYESLIELAIFDSNGLELLVSTIRQAQNIEVHGPSPRLARVYATLMVIFFSAGKRDWVPWYETNAIKVAGMYTVYDDPIAYPVVFVSLGAFNLGRGQLADALRHSQEALHMTMEIGAEHYTLFAQGLLVCVQLSRAASSPDMEDVLAIAEAQLHNAETLRDPAGQSWGLLSLCKVRLTMGDGYQATYLMDRLTDHQKSWDGMSQMHRMEQYGLNAWARLLVGEDVDALESLKSCLAILNKSDPGVPTFMHAYKGTCIVALNLWDRAVKNRAPSKELHKLVKQALHNLDRFATVANIGFRGIAWRVRGLYWFLSGKRRRGEPLCRKALAVLDEQPLERAMAMLHLGQFGGGGNAMVDQAMRVLHGMGIGHLTIA